MSDQEYTEPLYSQSYETHASTPNDSWDGSCPASPLFRQELQNWYMTKENDGMLAGILVEDCLFYLESHKVDSDELGPTSTEGPDLVEPSHGYDRRGKLNQPRITATNRATDAPACPTIRDPLISSWRKGPARSIRRSSPSNRPSAPPHLVDLSERNEPFTRIGDGAESPRNQNSMKDDGGRSRSRQCPGRNEARSPRQKVWTGRAAEAQVDLSQARGIITRSAATTDGTISAPFTRKSCAVPQDRKSLLSQEIRTSRVAACDNAEPGESRATVLTLGAPTAPIVGYCPTGLHESTTPLGKYYPTNYEARKRTKRAVAERNAGSVMTSVPTSAGTSPTRPPPSAPLLPDFSPSTDAMPASSSSPGKRTSTPLIHSHAPPVIHVSRPTTVVRPLSEFSAVSSPLIQYKRDMVTQTVQKAKDVVQYAVAAGAQMDEKTQAQITRSLTLLSVCSKPKSPKIHPTIMSPGPVTPMTLDGDTATDYITARPHNHQAA